MNARGFLAGLCVLAALGGGFFAFRQHGQLAQLRTEAAALTVSQGALRHVTNRSLAQTSSLSPSAAITEGEKLEILRLRGEVTRLREQVRDLARVRVENEKLRSAVQQGNVAAPGSPPALPPDYLRRRDAQFAGFGTPESTLQSLLWAIEHQDTNVLFHVFEHAARRGMGEAFARGEGQEFWKEARIMPGYRIVGEEKVAEDEVKLKVEFLPGDEAQEIRLRQVGAEWKLKQ